MSSETGRIHGYYSPSDLFATIIAGLNRLGKDPNALTLDDLQPVDEFHIRGDAATGFVGQAAVAARRATRPGASVAARLLFPASNR